MAYFTVYWTFRIVAVCSGTDDPQYLSELIFQLIGIMILELKMSMLTSPSISFQDILQDVTRRIVETAHPKRIVLFGSAARGAMTRDSDLDMLVIMPGPVHRRQTAQKILRQLHGVALPVDIVVVTEEDVKNSEQGGYSIIRPAMKDGRIVYDAE